MSKGTMSLLRNPGLRRTLATVAVALVAPIALAGCAGENTHKTITAALVDGKPGFTPHTVTVHKGDDVDLVVRNTTDKTHGFDIEGYGIVRVIDPTAPPVHVKFNADKGGVFRIYCQLHPTHQTAQLVVA